ncbi:unnamed protein product [Ectocarpus sp. CCAP 1310/34]|nr:unnamed protein product [Ectocarpus sp. CCAP 1310/34]
MPRGLPRPTAVGSQQDEVQNRGGEGKLKIIYGEVFLKHRPPPGHPHPECPARVSTARIELDQLEGIEWATPSSLRSEKGRERALAAIERVHNPEYLEEVRRVCAKGGGAADFDTYICPDTFEVCIAAASAWMDAAESAAGGSPAFALARPPGHHATAGVGMGSGGAEDIGPLGNLKHLPFFGVDETWETYEPRFEEAVKWLEEFEPDMVLVSAGYDALEADELATASLQPKDYERMGIRLKEVFGRKVAFGLEGGYNLQVTPVAIRATIEPFLCAGA